MPSEKDKLKDKCQALGVRTVGCKSTADYRTALDAQAPGWREETHQLSGAAMADDALQRQRPVRGEAILAKKEAEAARRKKAEDEEEARLEAKRKTQAARVEDHIEKHDAFILNTKTKTIKCRAGKLKERTLPDNPENRRLFEASVAASGRGRLQDLAAAAKKRKQTGQSAPKPRPYAVLASPSQDAPPPVMKKARALKKGGRAALKQLTQDPAEAARPAQQEAPTRKAPKRRKTPAPRKASTSLKKRVPSWLQGFRELAVVNRFSVPFELQQLFENDMRSCYRERAHFLTKPTGKLEPIFLEVDAAYAGFIGAMGLPDFVAPQITVPMHPAQWIGANDGSQDECRVIWRRVMRAYEADRTLDLDDLFNEEAWKCDFGDTALSALHGYAFGAEDLADYRDAWRFHVILDDGGASCSESVVLWPTPLVELFKGESDFEGLERYIGPARLGHIKVLITNATRAKASRQKACLEK